MPSGRFAVNQPLLASTKSVSSLFDMAVTARLLMRYDIERRRGERPRRSGVDARSDGVAAARPVVLLGEKCTHPSVQIFDIVLEALWMFSIDDDEVHKNKNNNNNNRNSSCRSRKPTNSFVDINSRLSSSCGCSHRRRCEGIRTA